MESLLLPLDDDGGEHGEDKDAKDDDQRKGRGYFDVPAYIEQHLDTYEAEDDAKTVIEIGKVAGDGGQGEIEGAKTQDGEDV